MIDLLPLCPVRAHTHVHTHVRASLMCVPLSAAHRAEVTDAKLEVATRASEIAAKTNEVGRVESYPCVEAPQHGQHQTVLYTPNI